MSYFNIPAGLAFLAGLASFFSPCVISLVPVYVSYLGGRAAGGETSAQNRWITFLHGLAFVAGFSLVFILFTIFAAVIGGAFLGARTWLAKIGGLIVIIFGLHMIGVFRIPFLEYDIRIHSRVSRQWGYASSFLMGLFFSAGWSPCVGPVLGSIMTFAVNGGSIPRGIWLGCAYSAGLGIPFLLAALGIGWVSTLLRKYSKVMRITEIVMGVLLIVSGILLIAGSFNILSGYVPFFDFGL